jgi:hypothetical protein
MTRSVLLESTRWIPLTLQLLYLSSLSSDGRHVVLMFLWSDRLEVSTGFDGEDNGAHCAVFPEPRLLAGARRPLALEVFFLPVPLLFAGAMTTLKLLMGSRERLRRGWKLGGAVVRFGGGTCRRTTVLLWLIVRRAVYMFVGCR